MNKLKLFLIVFIGSTVLVSCGGTAKQPATADGFGELEKEIKSEFGDESYFTDLNISYDKSIGNIIGITVTKNPESLKMEQWNQVQGKWTQNSEIAIEVPEGTKASDFMFQLGDKISLAKLGELIENSKKKLQEEKNLDNPTLYNASVLFPKNGDVSKTEYSINLKPENGGTTFQFYYALDGKLLKMDY